MLPHKRVSREKDVTDESWHKWGPDEITRRQLLLVCDEALSHSAWHCAALLLPVVRAAYVLSHASVGVRETSVIRPQPEIVFVRGGLRTEVAVPKGLMHSLKMLFPAPR